MFTQLLLDRGLGAAGVALNSAPTEGVPVVPLSQVKSTFPVLRNPANRHKAVSYDFEQFNYAFTNTFDEDEARRLYERYAVPVSGRILFESALANLTPGHTGTWVDYHNAERAPLLFVAGTEDNIMPPKVQWSNAAHYKRRGHAHRGRRVRRQAAPAAGRPRLGGDRRLRAGLGPPPREGLMPLRTRRDSDGPRRRRARTGGGVHRGVRAGPDRGPATGAAVGAHRPPSAGRSTAASGWPGRSSALSTASTRPSTWSSAGTPTRPTTAILDARVVTSASSFGRVVTDIDLTIDPVPAT